MPTSKCLQSYIWAWRRLLHLDAAAPDAPLQVEIAARVMGVDAIVMVADRSCRAPLSTTMKDQFAAIIATCATHKTPLLLVPANL